MKIAISPCPNDTFLFYFLQPAFELMFADVESLNQSAKERKFEITKLSFAALFHVLDDYVLLKSGSALGRGCGPLLVKRKGGPSFDKSAPVLIPGKLTTANLLLSLYRDSIEPSIPMRYELIIPALQKGEADFGVVIHEERFTYLDKGLELVQDLGEAWENWTGLPIPLGAIAMQRKLGEDRALLMEESIKQSYDWAFAHQSDLDLVRFIQNHSQNPDPNIISSHIGLYVNSHTRELGEEGKKAVRLLQSKAIETGFAPLSDKNMFWD